MTDPALRTSRTSRASRTGTLSWPAATWTVPVVPGLVVVVVAMGSRTEGQSRLLTLAVLAVVAVLGLVGLLAGRGHHQRGVGAGLLAGAVAGGLLLLGLVP